MPVVSPRLQWPVAAHLFEGHPPDEQCIGGLALFAQRVEHVGLIDVIVSARGEPAPGCVYDAVDGDVLGDDQLSHVCSRSRRDVLAVRSTVGHGGDG